MRKCNNYKLVLLTIWLLVNFNATSAGQSIDHWETIVYNTGLWNYFVGSSAPPADWKEASFDQSQWAIGQGGFGYGDNDDTTVIPQAISVYLRRKFDVIDKSAIRIAALHADYDDGFVAYLNGVEIARSNIGQTGIEPLYFHTSDDYKEAVLYAGGQPEAFLYEGFQLDNLLKEGENVLAIQVHNYEWSSSDLSSNFFFSVGVTDAEQTYGSPPSWFIEPFMSSNLPLISITTTETTEIFDEPRVKAHMGIVDNGPENRNKLTDAFNGYDGAIAIEIRGASSQSFPKKNYGFETQTEAGGNLNVELLGMPKENDWVLHGPYSDKSLLRNVLAYHLGNLTNRYTPRTRLCELFINDDYRGVYILTERIKRDKNRVDIANLTTNDVAGDELTGGYIVQIDRDDPSTIQDGWYSGFPDNKFYAFDDPDYDDLLFVQKTYIRDHFDAFESAMDNFTYQETYEEYVDVESYIDYFLVTEMGKHIDAYKLSFFMYKKKESNGGKIHLGPLWDFNLAFGNFDFACSPEPEGWSYLFKEECSHPIPFWLGKIIDIPQVSHQTNCRWKSLREGPFKTSNLMDFIDEQVERLGESSQRNFKRWPVLGEYVWPNNYVGQSYEEEVAYLKNWLVTRLAWMDEHMIGDCDLFVHTEEKLENGFVQLYPNPASDQIHVRIESDMTGHITLKIFDILGSQVLNRQLDGDMNEISLENIPSGFYIYVISRDQKLFESGKLNILK